MKTKISLFLLGIVSLMASCSGTVTDKPKDVAISFLKAMREQNITLVKQTATDQVAKNIGQYLGTVTEEDIKEISSFKTTYESEHKAGNVYFERFLYGEGEKDTMILKLIKVSDKWKVAGVGQRLFKK